MPGLPWHLHLTHPRTHARVSLCSEAHTFECGSRGAPSRPFSALSDAPRDPQERHSSVPLGSSLSHERLQPSCCMASSLRDITSRVTSCLCRSSVCTEDAAAPAFSVRKATGSVSNVLSQTGLWGSCFPREFLMKLPALSWECPLCPPGKTLASGASLTGAAASNTLVSFCG